jgi:hypothetical protein
MLVLLSPDEKSHRTALEQGPFLVVFCEGWEEDDLELTTVEQNDVGPRSANPTLAPKLKNKCQLLRKDGAPGGTGPSLPTLRQKRAKAWATRVLFFGRPRS